MTGIDIIIYILSGITIFGVGSIVIGAYTKSKKIKELDNLVDMFYDIEHTWLDVERFCDATGIADITKERFEEAMKYRAARNPRIGQYTRTDDSYPEYDDDFNPNLDDEYTGDDPVCYDGRHADWYKYTDRYAEIRKHILKNDELEFGDIVRIKYYNDGNYYVITSTGRHTVVKESCVHKILPE